MTKKKKSKKVINPAIKFGHGLHRASKTDHKDNPRTKHRRQWIEDKMDNE